jgi:hypothetical protein
LLSQDTLRLQAGRSYRLRILELNPDFRVFLALCRGAAPPPHPATATTTAGTAPASASDSADLPPPRIRALLQWAPMSPEDCDFAHWQALAKDGADLPANQSVTGRAWIGMGPGETADFLFTPAPGEYTLRIVTQVEGWVQRVPIRVR